MYKNQINSFFDTNRDNFVNHIKALVALPSIKAPPVAAMPFGEDINTVLEKALEIASDLGFATQNHEGYVGSIDFSENNTALDILAHLDVVPVNPADWTVCQPFEPLEKDGRIYGRGSADDKGPTVAALYAMLAVKSLNIPLKSNVRLIVGTDEECGGSDIDYYYKKQPPAPATFSPDADFPVINTEKGRLSCTIAANFATAAQLPRIISVKSGSATNVIPDSAIVVLEGFSAAEIQPILDSWQTTTNQNVAVSDIGNSRLQLTTKGKAGHAAYPSKANNPVTGVLQLLASLPVASSDSFSRIKALAALFPHNDWAGEAVGVKMSDEISGELTISLNILEITESSLSAVFDSRTPICATQQNTADVIVNNCTANGLSVEQGKLLAPHHVPEDSPFVQTLLKAYERYTGKKGECMAIGGGTYVHGLANAVAFGPAIVGVENNMHGADEFAVIDDLITAAKIYTQVIIDICG